MMLALSFCFVAAGESAAANKSLNEGIALFNSGRYMEALGLFNQAKATDSDNPLLHYYMASALMKLNQKPDAVREYKMTLILEPDGKLAPLCRTALKALGADQSSSSATAPAAPAPAKISAEKGKNTKANAKGDKGNKTADSTTPKVAAAQTPQVIAVLCGCPLCHRVDLMVADLRSKYSDKVEFHFLSSKDADEKTQDLIKQYRISICPTVLLISDSGEPAREFTGLIPERDFRREVEELAKYSRTNRLETVDNRHFEELRKIVVSEVDSRVAHDQIRVNHTIKQIQEERDADVSDLLKSKSQDREEQIELVKNEAERRMKFIRDDFERRKKEWYAAAEARIKAIQSTGSYNKNGKNKP